MKSRACIGKLETVPLPSDAFAEAGFMPELHAHQRRHVETRKHVRSTLSEISGTEEDVIVIPVVGVKYVAPYCLW